MLAGRKIHEGEGQWIGANQPVSCPDPVEQAENLCIATQQQVVSVVDRTIQNGIVERAAAATRLSGGFI